MQSLLKALYYLHSMELTLNSIKLNNILYSQQTVKLTGLFEPVKNYKEKYNAEYLLAISKDSFYKQYAYQPPERKG